MEMRFENKIEKLSDIAVWADGLIRDGGYNEEKYRDDASTAYCCVKAHELWKIRDVALESMKRHTVYTNALKQDIADRDTKIERLEKEIEGRKNAFNELKDEMANRYITIENHKDICKTYVSEVDRLTKKLNRSYKTWDLDLKNHDKRETALVDEIAKKNGEIKDLKDTITGLSHEIDNYKSWNASLHEDIKHLNKKVERQRENLNAINKTIEIKTKENYRLITVKNNQEKEIEAHEEENKKLEKRIEELKETMTVEEYNHTAKVNNLERELKEEDDHGREGFERYIKYIISTEETKFKAELNRKFSEEVSKISRERTEEELAKAKLNEKFGYAWETAVRLRSEVDKKRIVDISEGAERILGVSRELFDDAVKALVDDGYQEIIGRIPQATNSYVYMEMHVLAAPDVKTKDTANPENIKSLDSGIPCGSDSIE